RAPLPSPVRRIPVTTGPIGVSRRAPLVLSRCVQPGGGEGEGPVNASQASSASGPSAPVAPAGPLPAVGGSSDLFWSLQYCRASALSLTRLELALASSDRQRIVEAIDRLH